MHSFFLQMYEKKEKNRKNPRNKYQKRDTEGAGDKENAPTFTFKDNVIIKNTV